MSYQMSDVNIGAWIDPYSFNRKSIREQRVGSMFVCNSICDFIVVKQVGEPAMGLSVSLSFCYVILNTCWEALIALKVA